VFSDAAFITQDAFQADERAGEVDERLVVIGCICWHRVIPERQWVSLAGC
jgi:hypothetical protein